MCNCNFSGGMIPSPLVPAQSPTQLPIGGMVGPVLRQAGKI